MKLLTRTFLVALVLNPVLWAEEKPAAVTLPDDADKAWAEVQTASEGLRPKFRTQPTQAQIQEYQKAAKEAAGPASDNALAFLAKFPKHPKALEARQLAIQGLSMAVSTGDTARQPQFDKLLDETIADTSLPEDMRVQYFMTKQQMVFLSQLRSNPSAAGNLNFEKMMLDSLRSAQKKFPNNKRIYTQLLAVAREKPGEEGKALAKEIVAFEGAPADVKKQAQDIVDGNLPFQIGKPLDIKFTAVDGREVDLAKLKGKVVLVDFWAVWCGPCVAEIPNVKKVYDQYHAKGFEIVGISFDNDKETLTKFVEERQMAWPQYFDGQGWQNAYGQKYGINSIPRMWLIGKDGNLADLNGRANLADKVAKMLEAPDPVQVQ